MQRHRHYNRSNLSVVSTLVTPNAISQGLLRSPRADGQATWPRGSAEWHHTIDIALNGDEFVPEVGGANDLTLLLLASLEGEGFEPKGWNAVVQPALTAALLQRTSEASVRLLLPHWWLEAFPM